MDHQASFPFIRSVADLLSGNYKQAEYGKVILPFNDLISGAAIGKIDVRNAAAFVDKEEVHA